MATLRLRRLPVCLLSVALLGLAHSTWAAPKAWLVDGNGATAKLDLTQNAIVQTTHLRFDRILLEDVAADPIRGNLFVPFGRGPYLVQVFDLRTLKRKGRLDFALDHAPTGASEAIRFIFPPTGDEFFARWWNDAADGGAGAFEIVTVDATTLRTMGSRTTSPPLTEKLLLDATGRQLYSITSRRPAGIDVFDVTGLTRTSTINLEPFLNPTAVGRGIDDFAGGKILIIENEKTVPTDPSRYTLFVFDVTSGQISPKIRTGMRGDAKLLPRTNRVLFDEKIDLRPQAVLGRPGDIVTPGRIHVYDALTATRLATVQVVIDPGGRGEILGVSAAEDVFYYGFPGTTAAKLAVISLSTFSVVKELLLPIGGHKMVVFDE